MVETYFGKTPVLHDFSRSWVSSSDARLVARVGRDFSARSKTQGGTSDDGGGKEGNRKEKRDIRNWIFNLSIQSWLQRSLFKRRSEGGRARYRRDKKTLARTARRFEGIRTGDTSESEGAESAARRSRKWARRIGEKTKTRAEIAWSKQRRTRTAFVALSQFSSLQILWDPTVAIALTHGCCAFSSIIQRLTAIKRILLQIANG